MLYLIKHYFRLYLYLAGNFGIFCFTTQGVAQSVPTLTQTPGLAPNYERAMTDEAVFTATEYNTTTSEIPVYAASKQIPATTTQMVKAHEVVTALQDQTALTAASLKQITSVSQLTDVQPTDWAFRALQSLVERYDALLATTGNPTPVSSTGATPARR